MIEMNNVAVICTTDDPVDDLKYHFLLKQDHSFKTKVLPAFRPDKALNIQSAEFTDWIARLSQVTGMEINSMEALKKALALRIDFFNEAGCRVSDHALDEIHFEEATEEELNGIMAKRFKGKSLTSHEIAQYKGNLLVFLGEEYARRGWVQQYHLNAKRNISSKMSRLLGADTGFDAVNDSHPVKNLVKIMDRLDAMDKLPKTILYSLNPKDNEALAAICNCFNEPGVTAKIQLGSAWWFNDQKDGIMDQMKALANTGLISRFVGMLTDSRSFLSYPRHDYFRRILCNMFGHLMEDGEYPYDLELVGQMVRDICYRNACRYFNSEGWL
jgi:glucuronate isomerase